jgi:hypothetical protein
MQPNWKGLSAALLACLLTDCACGGGRPRWVAYIDGVRCKGPGLVNDAEGVADVKLTCKGRGRPSRKGSLRLVYGESFLDGARLIAPGYDCIYLGSYLVNTGCDALFNCRFLSEDGDCAGALTLRRSERDDLGPVTLAPPILYLTRNRSLRLGPRPLVAIGPLHV